MKYLRVFVIALIAILFLGCEQDSTADRELQQLTEESMQEANRQIGMPSITNFQEKKLMKQIYELRDQEDFLCYAYIYNKMNGELIYLGRCMGYGLPYSTQFSNPEKRVRYGGTSTTGYNLPQPEPNGLFMPEGLAATWLLLVDTTTNEARPVYIEPEIIVSPFELNL